jgi:hypothetical protein
MSRSATSYPGWDGPYDPWADIEAAKARALANTGLTCNHCGLCEDCRSRPGSWRLTGADGEVLAEGEMKNPDFAPAELSTVRLSDSSVRLR